MKSRLSNLGPIALLALAASSTFGRSVSVTAAANLVYAVDALDAEFVRENPEISVSSSTGASGNIVAQVMQGAPFDIFLSADATYPRMLVEKGKADAKTLVVFASGRLVVWSVRPGVAVADLGALVRDPAIKRLAIGNPSSAPFGRAAKQALQRLGLWDLAQPKIVVGESISQAAQFVQSGNADAGFVALSIVVAPANRGQGTWSEIAPDLYDALDQCAVLTLQGARNADAVRYLAFLRGTEARTILEHSGYRTPLPARRP